MSRAQRPPNLPKVADPAWHGPIGEAVQRIAPATEADPIAMLCSMLALFGAMAGDTCYVRVGGTRHPPRIWPLIIGKTGSGRKGTSFDETKAFAKTWSTYAAGYVRSRVVSGLSSGEGLLAALGAAPTAGKDDPPNAQHEAIASDGKLTVRESEFARVLAATKRDGNTLGPILRQLWDEGDAAILTRQAPLKVTDAHVTVIAHVVPRELRLKLAEADLAGGTLNRFLLIASERPQLLPYEEERASVADLADELGRFAEQARFRGQEIRRDRSADALWASVYRALNDDEPDGILGSVLARGPAYTMRLALVYALADGAGAISTDHLLAGLAVWHYAAETAKLMFSDAQRLTDEERLAAYIAQASGGRNRTEIYNFFRRNKTGGELDRMIGELEGRGDVTSETTSTGGRPLTLVHWTGAPRDAVGELLDRASVGAL